jgi:hypothetical protein
VTATPSSPNTFPTTSSTFCSSISIRIPFRWSLVATVALMA